MAQRQIGRPPVALVILDGWGIGKDEPGNAILAANTPVMDGLVATCPNTTLLTSGNAVGLPEGQMGNSEVGHLNIGAGRVVYQSITRIDRAIAEGELARNEALQSAFARARERDGTLHLAGLVSDGGVHSHLRHLQALLTTARDAGLKRVAVHAFTDGRDTSPTSGERFIADLERDLAAIGVGRLATVTGRYYAMDRDNRWDRVELAYQAIVNGVGPVAPTGVDAVRQAYSAGITDEFVPPTVIGESTPLGPDDEVVLFNFRADRMRELTRALIEEPFVCFERGLAPLPTSSVTTLMRYADELEASVVFPPEDVEMPLARVVSEAGLTQFHCAETEKYPHVTFFINGGREEIFPGEDRRMAPSPLVATYDFAPEMSARDVADLTIAAIESGGYDLIITNFANCDMVGHTGDLKATVKAVEAVDTQLGRVIDAIQAVGGACLITADHGNAEEMIVRETNLPMTAHTTNPVPCVLVTPPDSPFGGRPLRDGLVLSTVAPTLLDLLELPAPPSMTTPSLLSLLVS